VPPGAPPRRGRAEVSPGEYRDDNCGAAHPALYEVLDRRAGRQVPRPQQRPEPGNLQLPRDPRRPAPIGRAVRRHRLAGRYLPTHPALLLFLATVIVLASLAREALVFDVLATRLAITGRGSY